MSFSAARFAGALAPGLAVAQGSPVPGDQLDSWIAIRADGHVTAYTGKCELGHGLYTAQMQLIAEEVGVPLSRVTLIQCDTAITPDQGTTSGAQSHPANFNDRNLAQAAATAREALVQMASKRLGVPTEQLAVADGVVTVRTDPSKKVGYGELIGDRKFNMALSSTAKRKNPRDWKILGTPCRV